MDEEKLIEEKASERREVEVDGIAYDVDIEELPNKTLRLTFPQFVGLHNIAPNEIEVALMIAKQTIALQLKGYY